MKAHSYADDTQVHVSTGAADVEMAVQRFVNQLHGEDPILDEQQQTEDECRQNAGDMDRIQTTACQSRHQGVTAAVCQHSYTVGKQPSIPLINLGKNGR